MPNAGTVARTSCNIVSKKFTLCLQKLGEQSPRVTNTQVGIGGSEGTQKQGEGQLVQSVFVHASSSHCSGSQWTGTGAKLGQVLGQTFLSVQWTPQCDSCRSSAQNKEKRRSFDVYLSLSFCDGSDVFLTEFWTHALSSKIGKMHYSHRYSVEPWYIAAPPKLHTAGGLGRYVGGKPCGSFVSSAAILKACSESDICTPKTQG